jgi:ribosomal protein S18 acetylase RimI-like enzyme
MDLDLHWGNVAIPFFNCAIQTKPAAALNRVIAAAKAHAAERPFPWFFLAADDAVPDLAQRNAVFARHGLHPAMELTGMIAENVAALSAPPEGLTPRPATTPSDYADMGEINTIAYEMPSGAGAGIMDRPAIFEAGAAIVGHCNNQPVSCAFTMPIEDYLYVGFVATLPTARRRGFAEACMRESLSRAAARTGLTRSVLHATAAGRPIYERMGYRPVATYTLFAEGH